MAWTLTAIEVIRGALQLCGAIGVGETVSDDDADLCLDSLTGVVKELPLQGFSWPEVSSTPVVVAWSGGTPSVVTPPADYFESPFLKYMDAAGKMRLLTRIPKWRYEQLDLTQTAQYPQVYYVAPDLSFKLWPTPTQNPNLMLTYQSIIPDPVLTATPSIQQQYLNALQYFLADEISMKYGVPQAERAEISARAAQKKFLMNQWAIDQGPVAFTVDDGCYPRSGPLEWR